MELGLANVLEKGNLQRVEGKQQNWKWIFVTLLGLLRISKTRYRWKALSLLTLLLTNLLT